MAHGRHWYYVRAAQHPRQCMCRGLTTQTFRPDLQLLEYSMRQILPDAAVQIAPARSLPQSTTSAVMPASPVNLDGLVKFKPGTRFIMPARQCFLFSRIIGQLTPKIIYFYYLKKYFLDQSIQKIFHLILKKEPLLHIRPMIVSDAEISLRSPRKIIICIIKIYIYRIKVSKKEIDLVLEKHFTGDSVSMMYR